MNRREFLALGGRVVAGAALLGVPGCGSAPLATALGSATPAPTPTPSPATRPPTDSDWTGLAHQLTGSLIRPADPAYAGARQLFNPRFDATMPAAIAYCTSAADVQRVVAFSVAHGVPLTARSGGHSYAGYSTGPGIVCDVSRMATVSAMAGGSAVIGGGARLIDVYAGLAAAGVAIPGGSCPTVGIAGLALGGGDGVVARKYGLTCDAITQLQIVTADSRLLTCDASENSDLFWACRGGGGGNFGIVTAFTFATHPTSELTLFQYRWPWAAAADVVAGWQSWITGIPDELWSNCHLLSTGGSGAPSVTVGGAFVGGAGGLQPSLDALVTAVGTSPSGTSVGTHDYLDAMLLEAGCSGTSVAGCRLTSQGGTLDREASLGRSDIMLKPFGPDAVRVMISGVEARQANPAATTVAGVALNSLGGAVNAVASDATAFVHRSALLLAQYNATWPTGAPDGVVQSNIDGVNALYASLRSAASGFAYQNYIDPALPDWQHAYYGTNLARLMQVKAKYDPDDVFRFAQSIPLR